MPRQPRVEYAGAIYHVTMRMVGGAWETGRELSPDACLFGEDAERERFLSQLAERVEVLGVGTGAAIGQGPGAVSPEQLLNA